MLAWSQVVSDDLMPKVERLKQIGYDGIEVTLGTDDNEAYRRLGNFVSQLDMEVNCVMPIGPDENPISSNPKIRSKAIDKIKWGIDRAADMEARVICGPFHSAFATFANKAPDEQELQWSAEVLSAAAEYAGQADITLAIEALNRFECYLCNTMEQLVELSNRVSHPNLGVMFDTHHANIEEKSFSEAIDRAAPQLKHVHISENDRGTPGDGLVQWDEVFASLSKHHYDGWLTIESFTRNDPEFANAINVWREFSAPWDVAEDGFNFIEEMRDKHGL